MLSAADRAKLVVKDGYAYPADIEERSGIPLSTVKNALTDLRKHGLVENSGEVESHIKAKQVRLTEDSLAVNAWFYNVIPKSSRTAWRNIFSFSASSRSALAFVIDLSLSIIGASLVMYSYRSWAVWRVEGVANICNSTHRRLNSSNQLPSI
jgi:hypothetical protein